MGALSSFVLLLASTGAVHEDAARSIQQENYRVVGVCPRVLSAPGQAGDSKADLGPLAEHWARALQGSLAEVGRARGFRVVDSARMEAAMQNVSEDMVRQPDFLKSLQQQQGLDALVVIVAKPVGKRYQQTVEVIATGNGKSVFSAAETNPRTVSDAVYAGESFELRRWVADNSGRWQLTKDRMRLRGDAAYGLGPVFEQMQYASMTGKPQHPLLQQNNPLGFRVVVYRTETRNENGQPLVTTVKEERPLQQIGDEVYVALEPGEEYGVDLWNVSPRETYALLYVDGVNSINAKLQHPGEVADHEVWWMDKGREHAVIKGWLEHDGETQRMRNFKVVPATESVAGKPGMLDRVGSITCIFYTKGIADLPQPQQLAARGVASTFGTGGGAARDTQLDVDTAATRRGLVLSAMTVHYRTAAQIAKLKSPQLRPPQPGVDETPMVAVPVPMPKPMSKPDETVAFPGTTVKQPKPVKAPGETVPFPGN